MNTKFWYVYKIGGGPPRYKHASQDAAIKEAGRLVESIGGEYEILEAQTVVEPLPKYLITPLISASAISREQNPEEDCDIPF